LVSLVAHSGGAGNDDPDDNSYNLSYYGVPLVEECRRNSFDLTVPVGSAAGFAVQIGGHVMNVP
jgi:hypothetical protein